MARIHPTASVDPSAELADDVVVEAGAVIGPGVRIGAGSVIGPGAVIDGDVTIGERNRIFAHAVLGTPPQDIKYRGEPTRLEIGDDNLIREFVTIHRGTPHGGGVTRIGSRVFLMAYAHVAHDNVIADDVVVANAVQLAGHVVLGRYAVVGGCTAIHQFTRVGDHAFIGGASVVVMDVPPFCKASGNRARLMGLNSVGLKRRGFGERHLRMLRRAYRLAFRSGLLLKDAVRRIREEVVPECEPACLFADFLESSTRGITR